MLCEIWFAGMDNRSEWMYRMKRMELQYLVHVRKFVAAAKAHRESLNWTTTICPCSHCMNMRAHVDSEVQSHFIRFGFVKNYTVWNFHGEKVDATSGASGGNSSSSTTVNADHVGRQPASSSSSSAASNDNARDYITMEDLFQDMAADDDGGGDADEEAVDGS